MPSFAAVAKKVLPRPLLLKVRRAVSKIKSLRRGSLSFAERPSDPSAFPFVADHDNPLEALGTKYDPTKRYHNYLIYYWIHMRDIRHKVTRVLEIGVQTDKSIRMWEEFFPNATIFGIDIDPKCRKYEGSRRRIFIGDQGDISFLQRTTQEAGPFDIIIDDGSHRVEHQLTTFNTLFPHLTENGLYVIEDTGGVVGDFGLRTVNTLKQIIDHIMYWPKDAEPSDWARLTGFPAGTPWIDRNVVGIAFYRWIVFVMRGRNPAKVPLIGVADESSVAGLSGHRLEHP
jgi:hypothetical protein